MKPLNVLRALCVVCLATAMTACGASHYSASKDPADLPFDKAFCEVKAEQVVSDWAVAGEMIGTGLVTGILSGGLLIVPTNVLEQKQTEAFEKCMRGKGWSRCKDFGGC